MKIGQINSFSFAGVRLKSHALKKAVKTDAAARKQLKLRDESVKIRKTQEEIAEWHTAQRDLIEDLGSLWDD